MLIQSDWREERGIPPTMPFLRVLLVEDYEPFRRFVCLALQQRAEFHVIGEVSDGLEAVQRAQELQPDLILLDIGLPKMNGLEAGRRIRRVSPNSKILFLSQESSPDVVREALSLGAQGYVLKARAQSDLLPAIEAVLGGKRFVSSGLGFSEGTDAQVPHRHEILFCSDEAVLLDSLTQFIAAALSVGNAAIVWATEPHRVSLLQSLHAQGVDVDAAIRRGTYISSDTAETPDPVRMLKAVRGLSEAAAKAGKKHPRVAVCGERAGRLWAEGKMDEATRLEQLCDDLAKGNAVDILCVYPSPPSQEDEPAFKSACAGHTAVYSR
jgi:DNA-binding NarL/FixJ family response regulator